MAATLNQLYRHWRLLTERDVARAQAQGGQVRAAARNGRLAVLAGSVTALVIATLAGSSLGFLNKAACRAGGLVARDAWAQVVPFQVQVSPKKPSTP